MKQRIFFANIGWMAYYQGITDNDMIVGGGSYDPNDKHEVYNFQNLGGKCYGYVQNGKNNLSRIDESLVRKDYIDDVLVIWTATNDKVGGRYVVGWYKNARVYADYQKSTSSERKCYGFNIVADAKDCTLVPPDKRQKEVPRGTGFMGQKLVWYADGKTNNCTIADKIKVAKFREEVITYIQNYKCLKHKRTIKKIDTNTRDKVEECAMDYVKKQYSDLGYKVDDVHEENLGWDLEATKGKLTLKIEVKGLGGNTIDFLLSRNEYEKMKSSENAEVYRVCVVTNALSSPELTTFLKYSKNWVAEDDPTMILEFTERTIEAKIKQ